MPTPENREFIAQKMNSANWIIQALEQRRQTMLKVMNFIVDRQRDFFEKDMELFKPLTLREVAEVINMHESTVSRVTNEKYVQTPRGVLRSSSSSRARSPPHPARTPAPGIRAKLEKMVAEEKTPSPLTDQQIVHSSRSRASRSRGAPSPSTATSSASFPRGCGSGYERFSRAAARVDVSVLVPAKDEAENLPEFVRLCHEALAPAGFSFEVVVVNDGPADDTRRSSRISRRAPVPAGRCTTGASAASPMPSAPPATSPGATSSCSIPPTCSTCPRTSRPWCADSRGPGRHRHRHQAGPYEKAFVSGSTTASAAGCSASASPT